MGLVDTNKFTTRFFPSFDRQQLFKATKQKKTTTTSKQQINLKMTTGK